MSKDLSWNEELSEFLTNIGLIETSECLKSELVILSRNQLERLPEQLEKLIEQLLKSLERHVTAKEEILMKEDKTHPDLLIPKRKRGEEEDEWKERVKKLDSDQVQIRATHDEIEHRINSFIQTKQNELDESNRTEFLNRHDPAAEDVTCARTDAREINRNIQMKFDIVNNEDGPLARSLLSYHPDEPMSILQTADMEERLLNLEEHLNVKYDTSAKPPFSVVDRIKILENTLMDIERQHPLWAAVHLNQPNRSFPPPPPMTYISRPSSPTQEYVSTQITHTKNTPKLVGRANSSLTRAVIEQLQQQKQVVYTIK